MEIRPDVLDDVLPATPETVGQSGAGDDHDRTLHLIVLAAPSNDLEDLLPLVPRLLQALPEIEPGQLVRVGD